MIAEPASAPPPAESTRRSAWLRTLPPLQWLPEYRLTWLPADTFAGITLAAYAIPVSLAYATLAGLPPQVGVYGYMLGGLGYALLGSSRQLAVGPTSAISLMIAATVAGMADGNTARYGQIASLAGFTVALLCLIAWALRLSKLVKLISDSILVGFKAGAGLTIAMTQLPGLLGTSGGGHNFFERAVILAGQLGHVHWPVLAVGVIAIAALVLGNRLLPGRPVALAVVVLSIVAAALLGLPGLHRKRLRGTDFCCATWICAGPPAGTARDWCSEPVRGSRTRLPGGWRTIPICRERQGRCPLTPGAGDRRCDAGGLPVVSVRLSRDSADCGPCCRRA
jgi:MFS superfamily sulfate permease-like transporter